MSVHIAQVHYKQGIILPNCCDKWTTFTIIIIPYIILLFLFNAYSIQNDWNFPKKNQLILTKECNFQLCSFSPEFLPHFWGNKSSTMSQIMMNYIEQISTCIWWSSIQLVTLLYHIYLYKLLSFLFLNFTCSPVFSLVNNGSDGVFWKEGKITLKMNLTSK